MIKVEEIHQPSALIQGILLHGFYALLPPPHRRIMQNSLSSSGTLSIAARSELILKVRLGMHKRPLSVLCCSIVIWARRPRPADA